MPFEIACLHFEFNSTPPLFKLPLLLVLPLTSVGMPSGEGKLEMAHETHPAVTSILL